MARMWMWPQSICSWRYEPHLKCKGSFKDSQWNVNISTWIALIICRLNMTVNEGLSGVLGNRGKRVFISGEQGIKGQILRGTGEQRQYWGTGNIRKQIFDFWGTGEQANLFQGNKGTGTPPWEGLVNSVWHTYGLHVGPIWIIIGNT